MSKNFSGYELLDQMQSSLRELTSKLCNYAIKNYPQTLKKGVKLQKGKETFFQRSSPKDSKLNINQSIKKLNLTY